MKKVDTDMSIPTTSEMADYPGNPDHVIVSGGWDYYCTKCGMDIRDITLFDPAMKKPCEFRTSTIPVVTRPRKKSIFERIFGIRC